MKLSILSSTMFQQCNSSGVSCPCSVVVCFVLWLAVLRSLGFCGQSGGAISIQGGKNLLLNAESSHFEHCRAGIGVRVYPSFVDSYCVLFSFFSMSPFALMSIGCVGWQGGGGISIRETKQVTMTVTRCTFAKNSASCGGSAARCSPEFSGGKGGALYVEAGPSLHTLSSCNFSANSVEAVRLPFFLLLALCFFDSLLTVQEGQHLWYKTVEPHWLEQITQVATSRLRMNESTFDSSLNVRSPLHDHAVV